MRIMLRASALVCVLMLLAWQQTPVQAEPKDGDFASGWNTWKTSAKGDWVEYSIGGNVGIRNEVTEAKDGKISYLKKTLDAEGKETSSKELKNKAWNSIRLQGSLPYKKEHLVEWKKETLELSGTKLECDVAEWALGGVLTQIFYCKDVPCGGIVKTTSGGADSVWLTSFHTEAAGAVESADTGEANKSEMPKFYATVGNVAVLKISGTGRDDSYQRREVTSAAKVTAQYTIVACDESGEIDPKAKSIDREQTKSDWDETYGKPTESGVTIKVAAGEFKCDVYKTTDEKAGKETTEWISEGAPVKKLIKTKTTETVLELVKIEWK